MPWPRTLDIRTLHAVLERVPVFIVYLDAERTIQYVNRTGCGLEVEQMVGRDCAAFHPPGQEQAIHEALDRARDTRAEQYLESFIHAPDDGHRISLACRASALFDERDTLMGYMVIIEDGSAEEARTEEARTEEARTAEARARELDQVREELLRVSERAGLAEVTTDVLHDIANVLSSVMVTSALFIDALDGSRVPLLQHAVVALDKGRDDLVGFLRDHEKGRDFSTFLAMLSEELAAENARLRQHAVRQREQLDLIRTMLSGQQFLARPGSAMEPIDLSHLVHRLVDIYLMDIERHQIELEVDVPARRVSLDRQRVVQILANLLRNAIEALARDATSKAAPPRIRIAASVHDDSLALSVRDNGVGIPAENLERVFERGFTTKRRGHGFGLHASAVAAQSMGGSLVVESEGTGRGATFLLTVPLIGDR